MKSTTLAAARVAMALAVVGVTGCSESCSCRGRDRSAIGSASSSTGNSIGAFGERLPGAPSIDAELAKTLEAKWSARPPEYTPRTRHLRKDGSPKYTNRLFLQSSPYLLQHAHNPVDWYAWGDEAFEAAQRLHRPVFLSVGYSTCHWCHVMEEESFEDEDIARYLNENFIAIKVDREERPDVDALYMQAVQVLSGTGGWPMNVWLTPDRKPFYGGTYYPARAFSGLLHKVVGFYRENPGRVVQSAGRLTDKIRRSLESPDPGGGLAPESVLGSAVAQVRADFDSTDGGMKRGPKFPSTLPIRLLLHYYRRTGDAQSLKMAVLTLEKMAAGGIHDQVGGGFHRYSTDAHWLVPHFETMLYDNALLAMDYLAGYQVTGRKDFAAVARDIVRYVQRDMTSPEGAFYSATDADSLGPDGRREEGWFYTFTPAEWTAVLGEDRGRIAGAYYGVTDAGNFHGRTILNTAASAEDVAKNLQLPVDRVTSVVQESRDLLYAARATRPRPARDEKILAAWNGLMISAYAQAALVLGDADYAASATRAAAFVLTQMRKDGRLLRSFEDGAAHGDAFLDDYACFIAGLLDLFEATGDPRWFKEALGLDEVLAQHYEDPRKGGFFLTSDDRPKLLAREKPALDGAEPSGNSVEALNLLRLQEFTLPDRRFEPRADRTLGAFKETLVGNPLALSEMLLALDFRYDAPKEIVIVTPKARDEAAPFLERLGRTFLPNRVLSVVTDESDQTEEADLLPAIRAKVARKGAATAYVCENQTCDLPTTDPDVFGQQIRKVRVIR
ncbi:MAG: thioredoxin domain-containing protein [Polyangiaceae bacterium]|jgi:uncharacterized protein YyaL (SSP411 family)